VSPFFRWLRIERARSMIEKLHIARFKVAGCESSGLDP
jgi:hypothetical protein